MGWIVNVLSTGFFSWLGWYIGDIASGTGLAIFLSLNGMIVGWYAARRFMAWLDA